MKDVRARLVISVVEHADAMHTLSFRSARTEFLRACGGRPPAALEGR